MERIYVYSPNPLPKSELINTETGFWEGRFRNTLLLETHRSEDYKNALELIFDTIVRYIVERRPRPEDCHEAEYDFCRRLSAYLRITGGKIKIKERISQVLEESGIINIEGFVNFRLKDISDDIAAFFDLLFYKRNVQRRYESFISLVRDYVDGQPAKEPIIHIVFGGGFTLYDMNSRILAEDAVGGRGLDWDFSTGNPNDFLISNLLYHMPEKIIIHQDRNAGESARVSSPIIHTINSVFENRTAVCTDKRCLFCGRESGAELGADTISAPKL